jgi:phosphopantothenoylcysteine decarboxylase/phosphopantothenate--cysteine ligase
MGYRLAEAARDRGARVVLVSGPTALMSPAGIEVVAVRSAEEMAAAVAGHGRDASIVVMAAAVSDYRPAEVASHKLKKAAGGSRIDLVRTTDILKELGADKRGRFLVGFAAETENVLDNARRKRAEKRVDLLVANDVSAGGFAADDNAAVLIDDLAETPVALTSKRALADRIWDRVVELRKSRRPAAVAAKR